MSDHTRIEKDSMGSMEIPAEALYGASTQRATENFPISGRRVDRGLIRALGWIKGAAARANFRLARLSETQAALISRAAQEVADGTLDVHFPVDLFQTGSGTSTHMNVNEVIANRCSQFARTPLGSKLPVHPNDHVNLGQSSNDVFPSAIHLAVGTQLHEELLPSLNGLGCALTKQSRAFWDILKLGRTHLMDATPVRLGQEFSGYAAQITFAQKRIRSAICALEELPLGGTAVGTGLNTHPDFSRLVLEDLSQATGMLWREASNHFEAQSAKDALVEVSGMLKTVATSLFKICNDLRWLASGPHGGLGEILLPATQPGSSMMPGKVNPVICEAMMQVCARVFGNDTTVTWAAAALSSFELNVGMPVIAHALLESIHLLIRGCVVLRTRCVEGILPREERCTELLEGSTALCTGLTPGIGYDRAAAIAKESAETGVSVRDLSERLQVLPRDELALALDPARMTAPIS